MRCKIVNLLGRSPVLVQESGSGDRRLASLVGAVAAALRAAYLRRHAVDKIP
jgi:hypothetical protein